VRVSNFLAHVSCRVLTLTDSRERVDKNRSGESGWANSAGHEQRD